MKFRRARRFVSLTVALLFLMAPMLNAHAAYNYKGYMFTYSRASLPPALSDYVLETRMDAALSLPWLWDMGYDAGEYLNNSVDGLYLAIPEATVFTVSSHGGPGYVVCPDGNTEYAPRYTWLTGKKSSACPYYSRAMDEFHGLPKTKLMIFACCETALTSDQYGNLLTEAVHSGAGSAIGWNVQIPMYMTSNWMQYFFETCYYQRCDITAAADAACQRLKMEFPSASYDKDREKLEDYSIQGYTNMTIY